MAVSAGKRGVMRSLVDVTSFEGSPLTGEFDAPGAVTAPALPRGHRRRLIRRALIAADVTAFTTAYLIAVLFEGSQTHPLHGFAVFVVLLPLWVLGTSAYGLYDRDEQRPDHTTLDDAGPVFAIVTIGTWLGLAVSSIVGLHGVTIDAALLFWVVAFTLVISARAVARSAVRRQSSYPQNTIIVGAGDVGQLVGRKMLQHPEFGINLIGFVDSEPKQMRSDLAEIPLLGPPEDIVALVRRYRAERVVVAFSNDKHDLLVDLVRSLQALDVQIDLVPRLFEAVGPAVGMHAVEGLPLVGVHPTRSSRSARAVKRGTDLIVASAVLVVTAPLLAIAAWRIKRDSPGPVLFRQERVGKNMEPFTLYKFRTMRVGTDPEPHREFLREIMDPGAVPSAENANLYKLERRADVTRVGSWLRRTSLDELPQLLNVVRGEMSLVGPRPCIAYEMELYEPHHFDRFLVPAGMTGLWQVAARAHATFKEALDLDAAYARNWTLRLDLRLLARTPWVIVRGRETM